MNRKPNAILILFRPLGPVYRANVRAMSDAARSLGHETVVIAPCGAELPHGPSETILLDAMDPSSVVDAARDLASRYELTRVFPLHEHEVRTAARIRQVLTIPGMTPAVAELFRDKNAMHDRARDHDIATPLHRCPQSIEDAANFAARVGYPVVVKPSDGAACADTHRVDSEEALRRLGPRLESIGISRYRIEEYVRGPQYHVDAMFQAGEPVYSVLSRYTYDVLSFRDEPGGTITRRFALSEGERQIVSESERLLRAFGLENGPAHVEFFLRDGQSPCLGEAAARIGGGSIVPSFSSGLGIHIPTEWVRIELDPAYEPGRPTGRFEVGTEYLTTRERGRIAAMSGAPDLLALDDVIDAGLFKSVGDLVLDPERSSDQVLGYYVCTGDSFDGIRSRFEETRARFDLEIHEVGDAAAHGGRVAR